MPRDTALRLVGATSRRTVLSLALLSAIGSTGAAQDPGRSVRITAPVADTLRARGAIIVGAVIDPLGRPLANVDIQLVGTNFRTRSDERGEWRFDEPPDGARVLLARLVGYVPVSLPVRFSDNARDTLPLVMRRVPATLSTVEIRARSDALDRDAALMAERLMQLRVYTGHLFTRDEILRLRPYSAADLIRSVVSINVQERQGQVTATTKRSGIGAMGIKNQPCQLQFYLNGFAIDADDVGTLNPLQFQSVEVHPQSTILSGLPTFKERCGAVVISTRPPGLGFNK